MDKNNLEEWERKIAMLGTGSLGAALILGAAAGGSLLVGVGGGLLLYDSLTRNDHYYNLRKKAERGEI